VSEGLEQPREADPDEPPEPDLDEPPRSTRRRRLQAGGALLAVVLLNVGAYALLATESAQRAIASVEEWAYAAAFVVSLLTNATLAVPVPYNPIILQLMVAVQYPLLIAVLASAGASLGESTGWWVGSQGRAVLPTRGRSGAAVRWLQRVSAHRTGAFWALVGFSAVPNPAFDVAGLVAGAAKVPYLVFIAAAFLGRLVRFSLFVLFGQALLDAWPF
jgi:membrane protein YqaA with SNARE-associated domain